MRDIFKFYGHDFDKWCVALIGENCSTNFKVASLLKKPHIGFPNHKLSLEVNLMVENQVALKQAIATIHKTMIDARKLKNAALLRN